MNGLPKRPTTELVEALRVRARFIERSRAPWEVPATIDMMLEAADRLAEVTAARDSLLLALKAMVEDLEARWDMADPRTNPGIRHNVETSKRAIAMVEELEKP